MRGWLALGLLVLQFAVPGSAQESDQPQFSLEDPVGDVGPAAATSGFVDIVKAWASVGEAALAFTVEVASVDFDGQCIATGCEIWITIGYRDDLFDAVLDVTGHDLSTPADQFLWGNVSAILFRAQGEGFVRLGDLNSTRDVAAKTFSAEIPWGLIESVDGFPARPGEPIRILGAGSYFSPHYGTPHNPFITRPPAETVVAADLATFPDGSIATVPGAIGDLSLATPLAVRYSNGEATTIHWPIEVANHGDSARDVALSMPATDFDARLPESVHVPANSHRTVSVYVTLPFAHQHGTERKFPLTATTANGDRTTLHLAVHYPKTPQPSGHHPDLYLHASALRLDGAPLPANSWMNADPEDAASNVADIPSRSEPCPGAGTTPLGGADHFGAQWLFPLAPGLRIGLDGRIEETASLDVNLVGVAALQAGNLHATLVLDSQFTRTYNPFANESRYGTTPIQATTGPANVAVHIDIPMPPDLDLLPPTARDNLWLAVIYCVNEAAPLSIPEGLVTILTAFYGITPYKLATGGHLRLPLNEYHELLPVNQDIGPILTVAEPVLRAPAGATVLWKPTVTFQGDGEYHVRLLGVGAPAATLHGDHHLKASNAPVELAVSLVVPDGPAGQVTDLVIDVTNTLDPSDSGALRLAVITDPTATLDQSQEVAGLTVTKDSPLPSWMVTLALGLGLLAFRRRQTQ